MQFPIPINDTFPVTQYWETVLLVIEHTDDELGSIVICLLLVEDPPFTHGWYIGAPMCGFTGAVVMKKYNGVCKRLVTSIVNGTDVTDPIPSVAFTNAS